MFIMLPAAYLAVMAILCAACMAWRCAHFSKALRLAWLSLIAWTHRPTVWLGVLAGLNFALAPAVGALRIAETLNTPIQICEAYILMNATPFKNLFLMMGLLLMLSDAPFIDERIAYIGLRVTRGQWIRRSSTSSCPR